MKLAQKTSLVFWYIVCFILWWTLKKNDISFYSFVIALKIAPSGNSVDQQLYLQYWGKFRRQFMLNL